MSISVCCARSKRLLCTYNNLVPGQALEVIKKWNGKGNYSFHVVDPSTKTDVWVGSMFIGQ